MPALGRLREKGLCELEVVVGYTECSRSAGAGVGLRRKQRKWKERRKSLWFRVFASFCVVNSLIETHSKGRDSEGQEFKVSLGHLVNWR